MLPIRRGSNPQPPDHQSDAHPTEPPRPANKFINQFKGCYLENAITVCSYNLLLNVTLKRCRQTSRHILQHLIWLHFLSEGPFFLVTFKMFWATSTDGKLKIGLTFHANCFLACNVNSYFLGKTSQNVVS